MRVLVKDLLETFFLVHVGASLGCLSGTIPTSLGIVLSDNNLGALVLVLA